MAEREENNTDPNSGRRPWSKWCRHGCRQWCIKYFWEGQLDKNVGGEELTENSEKVGFELTPTRRKVLAFMIPAAVFHFAWWSIMIKNNYWHLFQDKYYMSITMIFGSLIAGMTSEGGGAIAFPVMTLALGIAPAVARDFSFMIQSCGMSAAAFTIQFMKIKLDKSCLLFSSLGGIVGLIFGLHVIDPNLSPPQKKMGFVSIWFSFAFTLYLLNRNHKRRTFTSVPNMNWWKAFVLFLSGFVGGNFSAFAGSGIDICSFSILCLFFRVTEKVATPTSVILMAINTCFGFFWRGLVMQEISQDAWEYLIVCIPIVVFGAPIGSLIGSHFHRLVLAALVYAVDTVALVGAFVVVPQTPLLAGISCTIIVVFFLFFILITKLGSILMTKQDTPSRHDDDRKPDESTYGMKNISDVESCVIANGEVNLAFNSK